jgi:hypothetical protein
MASSEIGLMLRCGDSSRLVSLSLLYGELEKEASKVPAPLPPPTPPPTPPQLHDVHTRADAATVQRPPTAPTSESKSQRQGPLSTPYVPPRPIERPNTAHNSRYVEKWMAKVYHRMRTPAASRETSPERARPGSRCSDARPPSRSGGRPPSRNGEKPIQATLNLSCYHTTLVGRLRPSALPAAYQSTTRCSSATGFRWASSQLDQ